MENNILSKGKEIGLKIIRSKYFWYGIGILILWRFLKKTFPKIFGGLPDTVKLPDTEKSPALTNTWWTQVGEGVMNRLADALDNEYFDSIRRDTEYNALMNMDRAQLTYLYNAFNKKYSAQFDNKSMTKVIKSQFSWRVWGLQQDLIGDLVKKLQTYNLV